MPLGACSHDREMKLRLASRWLEPELMREAFAWDPEKEGY